MATEYDFISHYKSAENKVCDALDNYHNKFFLLVGDQYDNDFQPDKDAIQKAQDEGLTVPDSEEFYNTFFGLSHFTLLEYPYMTNDGKVEREHDNRILSMLNDFVVSHNLVFENDRQLYAFIRFWNNLPLVFEVEGSFLPGSDEYYDEYIDNIEILKKLHSIVVSACVKYKLDSGENLVNILASVYDFLEFVNDEFMSLVVNAVNNFPYVYVFYEKHDLHEVLDSSVFFYGASFADNMLENGLKYNVRSMEKYRMVDKTSEDVSLDTLFSIIDEMG